MYYFESYASKLSENESLKEKSISEIEAEAYDLWSYVLKKRENSRKYFLWRRREISVKKKCEEENLWRENDWKYNEGRNEMKMQNEMKNTMKK